MENKNLTAVNWLIENLMINGLIRLTKEEHGLYKELTGLAKQMEKKQIIEDYLTGMMHPLEMDAMKQAEQYYNENYGK